MSRIDWSHAPDDDVPWRDRPWSDRLAIVAASIVLVLFLLAATAAGGPS